MPLPLSSPLAYIGALTIGFLLYKVCSFIHLYFLHRSTLHRYLRTVAQSNTTSSPAKDPSLDNQPRSSSWALVTGTSDGIGLAFAQELCSQGFNIILHGRNPAKLSKVQASLHDRFPSIQIRTLILDASTFTPSSLYTALEPLKSLPITVLVNNVGGTAGVMRSNDFTPFADHTPTEVDTLITVNASFPTHLTRVLLPTLIANEPSLIMNIGSASSIGMPYITVYAGSKGYNMAWSAALTRELAIEAPGIEVLGIIVAEVLTARTGAAGAKVSWSIPTSETMAKASLDRVGCGRTVLEGYWGHGVQMEFMRMVPDWVVKKILLDAITSLMEARKPSEATSVPL